MSSKKELEVTPPTPTEETVSMGPDSRARAEASMEATCDFAGPAPAPNATCDFSMDEPGQTKAKSAEAPIGTVAFLPPNETGPVDGTCDFNANTDSIPVNATADFVHAAPATMGRDTSSESIGDRTSQRPAADVTQPSLYKDGPAEPPQQSAGRYVFKKFHAKGGMGEVWLAEDSDIGRPVALKRMLKGREKHKLTFMKEAQVTGQLEHPGVIPVHELSLDDNGQPYYVMKFVHGKTLKDVIADFHKNKNDPNVPREVEWLRLLNIFLDLCQTIAYAHSRGVIHRDIKPDNVMVGSYGETLVLDWGLAKVVNEPESDDPYAAVRLEQSDDVKASVFGSVKGSPYYFSPEVALGQVDRVDEVSDIYLLGGTLYELITGQTPRSAKKLTELIDLAQKTPIPAPRTLDATIPKALDAICSKALAHRKEDRYQTAMAMAEDVQRYLAGEPVSAYQENLLERTWRWVRKHRTVLMRSAAVVLVAGISLFAFMKIREIRAETIRQLKEQEDQAAATLQEEKVRTQRETDKRKQAEKETEEARLRDVARKQIADFRSAADEMRFYAASADPTAKWTPTMDAAKAEAKAKEALAIADHWGADLVRLPLTDQRAGLKKDMYDLLLELAQLRIRRTAAAEVKATQAMLDRAEKLQPATQSYFRLRAHCLQALGDEKRAAVELARANDPLTPKTALDHYLLGEQQRVESLKIVVEDSKDGKQAGIKGLLARRETLGKAIAHYRQAIDADPNHYWSYHQLGTCHSGLGAYEQAAEAVSTCVALRPEAPWGYIARGLALLNLPDRDKDAEADLNTALRKDADSRRAQLRRASLYVKQKKYNEAEADFDAVLALPAEKRLLAAAYERAEMFFNRAAREDTLTRTERDAFIDSALGDFNQVVDGGLGIRMAYIFRARIHLKKRNNEEALKNLTLFIEGENLSGKGAHIHEQRGRELRLLASEFPAKFPLYTLNALTGTLGPILAEKLDVSRDAIYLLALSELRKAEDQGSTRASLYDEIGSVEKMLAESDPAEGEKRLLAAVEAFSKGIPLAKDDTSLLLKRGALYVEFEKLAEARADFAAALKIDERDAEAHAGLGYAEAMLKSPVAARRHAYLAVLHRSGDYLILHNVACIFGALSKTDKQRAEEYQDLAIDHLRQAIDLWRKGNKQGPNELFLISVEPAFPDELRARPEFKQLFEEPEKK